MTPEDLVLTPRGLRFKGRYFPVAVGRGGLSTAKREGDGATPCGIHHIVHTLYRPDRLARPAPWATPIRPGDLWSDDPSDPEYNRPIRAPHRFGHESLRRPDPLYDIVLVTDWNSPIATLGRGSAIFLHIWRKKCHPTEGCIALRRDHLLWAAARIAPGTRLFVPAPSSV
ncbi:L,D-transpeptidase family protein [Tropicimonas marinistellae]|uniref:L,D-transpeptidase family protein n=1 Tax=Tropicimonas marinistellae TaxID=1739787 RepID=UPI00083056C3|nr:L,D-transpeptidase family protein [Tropicimonas marinistellae]